MVLELLDGRRIGHRCVALIMSPRQAQWSFALMMPGDSRTIDG